MRVDLSKRETLQKRLDYYAKMPIARCIEIIDNAGAMPENSLAVACAAKRLADFAYQVLTQEENGRPDNDTWEDVRARCS